MREGMKFALPSIGSFEGLVQQVARRIAERCPPVIANNPERTVSQERIEEILADTIAGALQFRQAGRVGFLSRLRLKSELRQALRETGFEEGFADLAAGKLNEQLSRSAG